MVCAISKNTKALFSWANFIISFAGIVVPSKFEVCTIDTNFASFTNSLYFSKSKLPSSSDLIILCLIPLFLTKICHKTKLELCSLSVVKTKSPFSRYNEFANKLIASVVFLVKIISFSLAFINLATICLDSLIFFVTILPNL